MEMEIEVLARLTMSVWSFGAKNFTLSFLSRFASFSWTPLSSRLMKWFNHVVDPTWVTSV